MGTSLEDIAAAHVTAKEAMKSATAAYEKSREKRGADSKGTKAHEASDKAWRIKHDSEGAHYWTKKDAEEHAVNSAKDALSSASKRYDMSLHGEGKPYGNK